MFGSRACSLSPSPDSREIGHAMESRNREIAKIAESRNRRGHGPLEGENELWGGWTDSLALEEMHTFSINSIQMRP